MNAESIRYSLRNLEHKKGRSFLTVFSILVGIATIFIFISFGWGLYEYTNSFTEGSSADKVLILAKGAGIPGMSENFALTKNDIESIERVGGVYEATGVYMESVKVSRGSEDRYVYVASWNPKSPMLLELAQMEVIVGRDLKQRDTGVILGHNYQIDKKIFDRGFSVNDMVEINDEKIKIIGFMSEVGNPQDDSQVYMTNDNFEKVFPEKDSYAQIIARVDIDNLDRVIFDIEKKLRKTRNQEIGKENFYVQSFEEMIESFSGALDVVVGFVILIALISVLVSAVNTANTMITSVLERYKEIGILKAIGARNDEILSIFLFESSFLGFVAGVLGVLLGWGMTTLAGVILGNLGWGFLQPYHNVWLFAGCVLFAVLTGAVSGIVPAIRASKTNTVDALRYE